MKYLLIIVLCVSVTSTCRAQGSNGTFAKDSTAYMMYLYDTFAKYYPSEFLNEMYKFFRDMKVDTAKSNIIDESYSVGVRRANPLEQGTTTTIMVGWEKGTGFYRRYQDPKFPYRLLAPYKGSLYDCMKEYHKNSVKKKFAASLKAFKTESVHHPSFYATIDSLYKGNVNRYVNDLFKNSILLNVHRSDSFINKPSAERFIEDPGVQFVMSLEEYAEWLEEQ